VVDVGVRRNHAVEHLASDLSHVEPDDSADRMIHWVENEHVEIAEVARNGEVHDLAAAVLQGAIMTGPAVEDEIDRTRLITFVDKVSLGVNGVRRLGADPGQLCPIRIGQRSELLQPASKNAG